MQVFDNIIGSKQYNFQETTHWNQKCVEAVTAKLVMHNKPFKYIGMRERDQRDRGREGERDQREIDQRDRDREGERGTRERYIRERERDRDER